MVKTFWLENYKVTEKINEYIHIFESRHKDIYSKHLIKCKVFYFVNLLNARFSLVP